MVGFFFVTLQFAPFTAIILIALLIVSTVLLAWANRAKEKPNATKNWSQGR
jgi:hypothetical protein